MYKDTHIWKSAFESNGNQHDEYRSRLRIAFMAFREKVGQLIQTIPAEIKGLTVHDLTHLDALWEMADLLTGDMHECNPAEVFVLGGAILLHDSAMTVSAYTGGLQEIKMTPEYADALAQFQIHLPKNAFQTQNKPDVTTEQFAISEALRIKHAHKAEELATQKWISPIDNSEVYLIDDPELRDHFGTAIGRIAHSHHWDIHDIPKKLGTPLGAPSYFPKEWTIDQVKIALLLRCADAMQIDDRRAPRFLSAVRAIGAASLEHWKFQNLLTVPQVEDQQLIYTSKRAFSVEQAGAWNLCFDTLQMIDKELRDTNDLQLQKKLPQFVVKGVAGASSPETLAKYITVSGWTPLPLNLKVSNVPQLAKTLGGKDLYNSPYAPLRELIQNAADAIEARSLLDKDFSIDDGLISVRLLEKGSSSILQVDDNGVGMSERVLTTVLLDFGLSFWKSSTARSEFPGIQKNSDRFRGKYGIGFFSVFMWSDEVLVSSRQFHEGINDSRVLDFQRGLESRPLLRPASVDEKSSKWISRVQLKLKRDHIYSSDPRNLNLPTPEPWIKILRRLCGALPIKVTFEQSGKLENASLPNWRDCTPEEFFNFFTDYKTTHTDDNDLFLNTLSSLSAPAPQGGRCFVSPYKADRSGIAVYEKGIYVNNTHHHHIGGVVEASVTNAARDKFSSIDILKDENWLKPVIAKAFALCRHIGEKIAMQKICSTFGFFDENQPLFITNRELFTLNELHKKIEEENNFHITLSETDHNHFSWKFSNDLSIIIGLNVDKNRVYPLLDFNGTVPKEADINHLISLGADPLFCFLRNIKELLGPTAEVSYQYNQREGYKNSFINIRISRPTNSTIY